MSFFTTTKEPGTIWEKLKQILLECKASLVTKGKINKLNKPFWNPELLQLSRELRKARKDFKYRSSYKNGFHLDQLKAQFTEELKKLKIHV